MGSDVYSDRRVPQSLREDAVLWGECISGALYWNDFHNLAKKSGFLDPRLMKDSVITVNNKKLEGLLGCIKFYSATYRLFKLDGLESHCEDYGQAVVYKGTVELCPDLFGLDGHHEIEKGKVFPVCGNTWRMLKDTRFARHFDFIGDFSTHYGIYDGCGTLIPFAVRRRERLAWVAHAARIKPAIRLTSGPIFCLFEEGWHSIDLKCRFSKRLGTRL